MYKNLFIRFSLGVIIGLVMRFDASAQAYASPQQLAASVLITAEVKEASQQRRVLNGNEKSIDDVDSIPFSITGPEIVEVGSVQTYNVQPIAREGFRWFVSCGEREEYWDDQITIRFLPNCSYSIIYLIDNNGRICASFRVRIEGGEAYPLSAGSIKSGDQKISVDEVPEVLICSGASGGSCMGSFGYQWQYSFDKREYFDILGKTAPNLSFEHSPGRTTYFRRRVICGDDTLYTGSVLVWYEGVSATPGIITTIGHAVAVGDSVNVEGTMPAEDDAGPYEAEWQISNDGVYFFKAPDQQNQLTINISESRTFVRRAFFKQDVRVYSNTVLFWAEPDFQSETNEYSLSAPANDVALLVDSIGLNLSVLFNIPVNDSVANSRHSLSDSLLLTDFRSARSEALKRINRDGCGLEAKWEEELSGLFTQVDNIAQRLVSSDFPGSTKSGEISLSRRVFDSLILTDRTSTLDTLIQTLSEETPRQVVLSLVLAESGFSSDSIEAKRSIAVIGGVVVPGGAEAKYTAILPQGGASSHLVWVVEGGTITKQNTDPAKGPLYADVTWVLGRAGFVGLGNPVTGEIGYSDIRPVVPICRATPKLQTVVCGTVPSPIQSTACELPGTEYTHSKWQQRDVYANSPWVDIPGSEDNPVYQPGPALRPWVSYSKVTMMYDINGNLIDAVPSHPASVKLTPFVGGKIRVIQQYIALNSSPAALSVQPASEGMFGPGNGSSLAYTWEASFDGGSWQTIGSGEQFPGMAPFGGSRVRLRRKAEVAGVATANVPATFWRAYSNTIEFRTVYYSVDHENRNYYRENVVLVRGVQSWISADQLPVESRTQTTTYLDGIGRAEQTVGKAVTLDEAGNQWYDLVQPVVYGQGGRVDKGYLPYPATSNPGKYKTNAIAEQGQYYSGRFSDNRAYVSYDFDNSPANQVLSQTGAGAVFAQSGKKIEGQRGRQTTADDVRFWTIGFDPNDPQFPSLKTRMTYTNFALVKQEGKDEEGNRVITYSDKLGRLVLKKVQAGANPSQAYDGWLSTYYVYDDLGQLRTIITPKAVEALLANDWTFNSDIFNLCFSYQYDDLGRPVVKKSPDKGAEYVYYDKRSRPVFVQDANMRKQNSHSWLTTLYDDLDRPVLTGQYFFDPLAFQYSNLAELIENSAASINTVTTNSGGTIRVWGSPLSQAVLNDETHFTQLTFAYYDDYSFPGAQTFVSKQLAYQGGNVEPGSSSLRFRGVRTGSKTRVLKQGVNQYLTTTVFYDEEGRSIQAHSQNIAGGVDLSLIQYHFDGRVLSSLQIHSNPRSSYVDYPVLTKYRFDRAGRLRSVWKKYDDPGRSWSASNSIAGAQEDMGGYKQLTSINYNEMGQALKTVLSPDFGNGQGLESLAYSYNIRGRLTGINRAYALGNALSGQFEHYFGIALGYESTENIWAQPRYNGQLTGVLWRSQGDYVQRKYDYEYDPAGRLTKASFQQKDGIGASWSNAKMDFSMKDVEYDANGNLMKMTQMGVIPGAAAPIVMDQLLYQYQAFSNRLKQVQDLGNNPVQGSLGDYKQPQPPTDYAYDENGNITEDPSRGAVISYNYLDKPEQISVAIAGSTNRNFIRYVYDAGGNKLQKLVYRDIASVTATTVPSATYTYIGAYIYKTDMDALTVDHLQTIAHEAGRIRLIVPMPQSQGNPDNFLGGGIPMRNGQEGVFDYFIYDHLGSVRAVVTEEVNSARMVCTFRQDDAGIKATEEAVFGNPAPANEVALYNVQRPSYWPTSAGQAPAANDRACKLQSSNGATKVGPNVLLKVMAGDVLSTKVEYMYGQDADEGNSSSSQQGLVSSLLNLLGGGRSGGVVHGQAAAIGNSLGTSLPIGAFFNNQLESLAPKAYLNMIFFDDQFNFVGEVSDFRRVSQAGAAPNHWLSMDEVRAVKNGYVYIYISNASNVPVWFDNFEVKHVRGRLIEENHYYPYGLKIAALSSRAVAGSIASDNQKFGYQGAFAEEVEEFDLGYSEFRLRNYDPQIGRFMNADPFCQYASPYLGMGNDPANLNDPSGGFTISMLGGAALGAVIGAGIGAIASGGDIEGIVAGAFLGAALGGAICEDGVAIGTSTLKSMKIAGSGFISVSGVVAAKQQVAMSVGQRATFFDENGVKTDKIPEKVQRMFRSEYGMAVTYRNGRLYYSGDVDPGQKISEIARKRMMDILLYGADVGHIIFGYYLSAPDENGKQVPVDGGGDFRLYF